MSEFVEALNNLSGWGLFAFVVLCVGVQLALSGLSGVFTVVRTSIKGKGGDSA